MSSSGHRILLLMMLLLACNHVVSASLTTPQTEDNTTVRRQASTPKSLTQLTNLPTLYINTLDGSGIYSKTEYKYASLWRVEGDSIARYDSMEIRGRGNSTWEMAKKPYRIKFAQKEKFLGKGHANARNWTLLANYADKTLIRNAVASYIGTQLGQPFTAAAEFVDLYLNDKYLGNYQISDQVQIGKKRIAITEQEEPATAESDITGGYFLEICGSSGSEPVHINTKRGTTVTIKSPDETVINWDQRQYIKGVLDDFETRLMGTDYQDPEKGYRAIVDSMTLASWFLGNEFTGNADGYYSVYFYKEAQDDHLYFGPLWDFDIAFNNCDRIGTTTDRMMTDAGFITCKWPGQMWKDPWFKCLVSRVWNQHVQAGLVQNTLAFVDSLAARIDHSQQLNFQIWPLSQHVYNEITLWSTYQEGVDYLKKFITEHADWLTQTLTKEADIASGGCGIDIRDDRYYNIVNSLGNMQADINQDNNTVCVWHANEDRQSTQQWYLRTAGETGKYYILSRESNLAATDVAQIPSGSTTYEKGASLELQEWSQGNARQIWRLVPTGDYWTLVNCETSQLWNKSGLGTTDGTKVVSGINNSSNANFPTRLWYFQEAGERFPDAIASPAADTPDYRITYDPQSQTVHLRLPVSAPSVPDSPITLYDLSGKSLLTGHLDHDALDVSTLPHGIYVITWTIAGKRHTTKFRKQ